MLSLRSARMMGVLFVLGTKIILEAKMSDSPLSTLLNRFFELMAELNSPDALTSRPAALSGRVALKQPRQAMAHADWLDRGYVEHTNQTFKMEINLRVVDLRTDVNQFLWSWADCFEDMLESDLFVKDDSAEKFLRRHIFDIEELEVSTDFRTEMLEFIRVMQDALGHGSTGVACPCGRGRMLRDDTNSYMCSACNNS